MIDGGELFICKLLLNMKKTRLIIFGRYPVPGTTKTRMIPSLGPVGAAELQRILTERVVIVAQAAASVLGADLFFFHEGGDSEKTQKWLGTEGLTCRHQSGGDLGERMQAVFDRAFSSGAKKTVLLGTDIHGLQKSHLTQAFSDLDRCDLVLGPSTDGGYWLVGMCRPQPVFKDISWSTPKVLEQTLNHAKTKGLTTSLLTPLSDLDTPSDLDADGLEHLPRAPYLSVILAVRKGTEEIASVVALAKDPDAELILVYEGENHPIIKTLDTPGVHVIQWSKNNDAWQNQAARAAAGQVLLFMNKDAVMPKGYIAQVFNALMDRDAVMGVFNANTGSNTLQIHVIKNPGKQIPGFSGPLQKGEVFFIRKQAAIHNEPVF